MAGSVQDVLEDDIYHGRLPPGARLKQIELERRYGCTRIALRQALEAATRRGLVQHEPNRGYRVRAHDTELAAQILQTRCVLEIAAARMLGPFITDDYLANLTALAEAFDRTPAGAPNFVTGNLAFHDAMLAPCPNRAMVDTIFELRRRVPPSVLREINSEVRVTRLRAEHHDIIAALRARDLDALEAILRRHILP